MKLRHHLTCRIFLDEVELIIFNPVQQRSYDNCWVPQAKPFHLAQNKINFVPDLEHRGEVEKMFLGRLFLPARGLDQSLDELLFAGNEVDHAALCMPDQCDAANSADSDGIRNFEFAVPQIRSPRTDNESEIIGDVKVLSIVHAHPHQQAGVGVRIQLPSEVVVLEQEADRGLPVLGKNIFF